MNTQELENHLRQFYGSEQFYRHWCNKNAVYTEGVKAFADNAGNGAYWFLDIMFTEPAILKEAKEFASVTLTVAKGVASIIVTDGGKGPPEGSDVDPGEIIVFSKKNFDTDCPDGVWAFYFENNTLMLPSER